MEPVSRKLTAILCADVAGYSRLMADDHEATLATLTASKSHLPSASNAVAVVKMSL